MGGIFIYSFEPYGLHQSPALSFGLTHFVFSAELAVQLTWFTWSPKPQKSCSPIGNDGPNNRTIILTRKNTEKNRGPWNPEMPEIWLKDCSTMLVYSKDSIINDSILQAGGS